MSYLRLLSSGRSRRNKRRRERRQAQATIQQEFQPWRLRRDPITNYRNLRPRDRALVRLGFTLWKQGLRPRVSSRPAQAFNAYFNDAPTFPTRKKVSAYQKQKAIEAYRSVFSTPIRTTLDSRNRLDCRRLANRDFRKKQNGSASSKAARRSFFGKVAKNC